VEAYSPPPNQLPDDPVSSPLGVDRLRIDE